jgi:hypothetical protein
MHFFWASESATESAASVAAASVAAASSKVSHFSYSPCFLLSLYQGFNPS